MHESRQHPTTYRYSTETSSREIGEIGNWGQLPNFGLFVVAWCCFLLRLNVAHKLCRKTGTLATGLWPNIPVPN